MPIIMRLDRANMNNFDLGQFKSAFIQHLRKSYPDLKQQPLEEVLSENLFSPFQLELPQAVLKQAQDIISAIFELREQPQYLRHYSESLAAKNLQDPGNKSIVMSYDFHLNENQELKLIEINTNAGFLALGHEMYKVRQAPLPVDDFSLQEIADNVCTEIQLQGKECSDNLKVAIIDNQPQEQKLYPEFLLYNELFKSRGWDSRIFDYRSVLNDFSPDFIYNRHTDFFLTESEAIGLRRKFDNKAICFSPNPFEYFMIADKQRLIDWSQPGFLEAMGMSSEKCKIIKQAVPKSYDAKPSNADEVWGLRKKLFLKPKNAFGSKQSYKGASISRKAFEDLIKEETIAQEYIPAPEVRFETPQGPTKFKYDLRCYAYQGRLQLVAARLYQGQVTNLKTLWGGFTCVQFT